MSAAAGDDVGARLVFAQAGTVRCQNKRGHVSVALEGTLDQATALALVDAVVREVAKKPKRVDIDLRLLTSFADDGVKALARCRELCSQLPGGLHYRTDDGPGQLALLEAFESEPLTEVE
jgi:hypothetical protein